MQCLRARLLTDVEELLPRLAHHLSPQSLCASSYRNLFYKGAENAKVFIDADTVLRRASMRGGWGGGGETRWELAAETRRSGYKNTRHHVLLVIN